LRKSRDRIPAGKVEVRRFLLARIGKPIAVAARKQPVNAIQLNDPATAVHAI
jgi:hypothetical protein